MQYIRSRARIHYGYIQTESDTQNPIQSRPINRYENDGFPKKKYFSKGDFNKNITIINVL